MRETMFDPTAFDNMKVVVEGALYDLDIIGQITILDRNDFINLAKMSRQFDISFQLSEAGNISAKLVMVAHLANLAAELLPSSLSKNLTGCHINLQFIMDDTGKMEDYQAIEFIIKEIWGDTRKISQTIQYNPLTDRNSSINVITVEFDRLIGEEQMDDLVDMVDFLIATLTRLQKFT